MIIYNVTIKIEHDIHDDWIRWMQAKHIPDVIKTGCFTKYKLSKLLDQDESDGITFSIQYFANTINDYQKYKNSFAASLQADVNDRYKNRFVAFRTLLEVISEQ